jgi:hypothetical protein
MLAIAVASPGAPLNDPVQLNIGIACHWERRCIDQQRRAMRKSLAYVSKYHPPVWRIQQCNRNAARGTGRVDWAGFDHCVRNLALAYRPPPPTLRPQPHKKRRR